MDRWCFAWLGESFTAAAQHDSALRDQLQLQLKLQLEGSVAYWRRKTQAHSLRCLGLFISADLVQGQSLLQAGSFNSRIGDSEF